MGIAIVGRFYGTSDGQTVKTRAIYSALMRYGVKNIHTADTYYVKRKPFRFIAEFFKILMLDRQIIVMVSDNGRKVLFPILYYAAKLGKKVYHYGIGGRLANEVRQKPKWKKYVSGFEANWMESTELVENLQKLGVKNAVYLPNFKRLNIISEDELCGEYEEPFRMCTFSRVMEEKGIEDAIRAVTAINEEYGRTLVELDIYGPAEEAYLNRLKAVLEKNPSGSYCGIIPADKSVEALKDYYALLFPTHYQFEGIPGTIIDALSAGVPVIARRWQYCDEMLVHGKTGYIYDFNEPEKLKDMILYAISHVQDTVQMKKNCIKEAEKYSEEYAMKLIAGQLEI